MSDDDTLRALTLEDIETYVPCDLSNEHVLFRVRGVNGWYRQRRENFIKVMVYLHDAKHMKHKLGD